MRKAHLKEQPDEEYIDKLMDFLLNSALMRRHYSHNDRHMNDDISVNELCRNMALGSCILLFNLSYNAQSLLKHLYNAYFVLSATI